MQYEILRGDCISQMRTMPDNSFDSIVCDPPYELGFMSAKWDSSGIAYSVEMWREALRVLKPGGHLLAFSGSRTYHRMTCAIEDAGFEIRDQIMWVYGQGFPKSNNLDNLRGKKICGCSTDALPYTHDDTEPQTERDLHSLLDADVSAPVDSGEGGGQVLQPSLPEQVAPATGRGELRPGQEGRGESSMEGRGDDVQAEGQLQGDSLRACAGTAAADGPEGRLHNGASAGDGPLVRLPADADGSGASRRPRSNKQPAQQPGIVAGQSQPQAGGAWPICTGCALPVVPQGLGTSLKPSHEPICVARKPLAKGATVAANVLQFGTGALNIDGCRVDGGARPLIIGGNSERKFSGDFKQGSKCGGETTQGRWPANLILSYNEDEFALRSDTTPEQMRELQEWMNANA